MLVMLPALPSVLLAVSPVRAEEIEEIETTGEIAEVEEGEALGLNVDVGWASMYVFRGLNVFADSSVMDQNMLFDPSVTWEVADTGLTVGWWSAWQLNGDNRASNVENAVGAEQDLCLTYEIALKDDTLTLTPSLMAYLYPFAYDQDAEPSLPYWLEPGATLTWSDTLDVGVQVAWMMSPASDLKGASYLYVRPVLGKTFDFSDSAGLELAGGLGYKALPGADTGPGNIWDVEIDAVGTFAVGGPVYVSPGLHGAWSNQPGLDFSKELMGWGSVNVGADF
jgi:hypothetical protein